MNLVCYAHLLEYERSRSSVTTVAQCHIWGDNPLCWVYQLKKFHNHMHSASDFRENMARDNESLPSHLPLTLSLPFGWNVRGLSWASHSFHSLSFANLLYQTSHLNHGSEKKSLPLVRLFSTYHLVQKLGLSELTTPLFFLRSWIARQNCNITMGKSQSVLIAAFCSWFSPKL